MISPNFTQWMARFFRISFLEKVAKWCALWGMGGSVIFFALGLTFAFTSPTDYQQGEYVRFMYIHVPASWFALFTYAFMTVCSISGLAFKIPSAHLLTRAFSVPGGMMALISVVTGSLWGKVTWGTFWVWDARLTSMFILLMIYGGYIFLSKGRRSNQLPPLAFLILVGCINLPIIKYSVDMWFTLHQPASIMRFGKPAIDGQFLLPLFTCAMGYLFYVLALGSRIFLRDMQRERDRQDRRKNTLDERRKKAA